MAKKFTPEEIEDLKEKFKTITENNFFGTIEPVKNIYVDLSMMVDYKLGALLLLYNDEKDYNYIVKQVKEVYNYSLDPSILTSFPKLAVTEENINEVLTSSYYNRILSSNSPSTNIREFIIGFIMQVSINNNKFYNDSKGVLNVYLNSPYFKLHQEAKEGIVEELKNTRIKIFFIEDPTYTHPIIIDSEYLFFNDLLVFNKSPLIKKMFDVKEFMEKTILIPYKAENPGFTVKDEDIITKFDDLAEKVISKLLDFSFVHRFVLCG